VLAERLDDEVSDLLAPPSTIPGDGVKRSGLRQSIGNDAATDLHLGILTAAE